jgi:YfiH family protein
MQSEEWFVKEKKNDLQYWRVAAFERLGCSALFSLRTGGVSPRKPYQGLNLGYNTDDQDECIRQNRELIRQAAGLGPLAPVCGQQIHGVRIQSVSREDAGRGWFQFAEALPGTDALITREPGLPLTVTTADCLPVLLAAEDLCAVATVHAGWRGIAGEIIPKAIKKLWELFQVRPDQIWAAVGPGIGPEAFIIQNPVLAQLQKLHPEAITLINETQAAFNLWTAAQTQMLQAGVVSEKIGMLRESTASNPNEYFSFRRDGETGRMMGFIQLNHTPSLRPMCYPEP